MPDLIRRYGDFSKGVFADAQPRVSKIPVENVELFKANLSNLTEGLLHTLTR
jgi:hypothetical protein